MRGDKTSSGGLLVAVSVLALIAVGLTITNVLVYFGNKDSQGGKYSVFCDGEEPGALNNCLKRAFGERYEAGDFIAALNVFQERIDKSSDDEEKGKMMIARIKTLVYYCGNSCKEYILSDVNELSKMPEDIDRLQAMCIYEKEYGDLEVAEQHCGRLDELKKERNKSLWVG